MENYLAYQKDFLNKLIYIKKNLINKIEYIKKDQSYF